MATDWKTRDEKDKAAKLALHTLADLLPAAMTAETGDEWAGAVEMIPDDWHPNLTGRERIRAATLTRDRDGFAIELRPDGAWNAIEKAVAVLQMPLDPTESGFGRMAWGSAPGVAYGDSLPSIGFSPTKSGNVAALARRIVRELVKPDFVKARAELVAIAAERGAELGRAADWRQAVADAAGMGLHYSTGTGRTHIHNRGAAKWADIETRGEKWPGGKLTIELPTDPRAAARMVENLRLIVESDGYAVGRPADFWADHPRLADWRAEVADDDTRLGFWAWLDAQEGES